MEEVPVDAQAGRAWRSAGRSGSAKKVKRSDVWALLIKKVSPFVLRCIMFYSAPAKGAGLSARDEWVRALLALEPHMRHRAPNLVCLGGALGGARAALEGVASIQATTARLPMLEMFAKDWIEACTRRSAPRSDVGGSWLATARQLDDVLAVRLVGDAHTTGTYALNKELSPTNGASVYTMLRCSDMNLFHGKEGMWCISCTSDVRSGKCAGWMMSATASISPFDLEWELPVRGSEFAPVAVSVSEVSAAALIAARAAVKRELARARNTVELTVAGETELNRDMMGTYALNTELSPKNESSVYSMEGGVDMHLFRGSSGRWLIQTWSGGGCAPDFFASNAPSILPFGCEWRYGNEADEADADGSDDSEGEGFRWHDASLLQVTEKRRRDVVCTITKSGKRGRFERSESDAHRIKA